MVAVADFEYRWAEGRNKRDRGRVCPAQSDFLICRSQLQILLLHNGRELVEIF
jgi:hypothetical protein